MIPKRYRLRKNSEFVATYAQKKYLSNSYISLNLGKTKPFNDFITKVAFVVSKKIDKRAVVRNKIKRRMREAYISLIRKNPECTKWISLIFTARKDAIDVSFDILTSQMEYLLEKAGQKYA